MNRNNSPYSAITGCSFLFYEFMRVLPLLMDKDSDRLIKEEVANNAILQVNSLSSRDRFMSDFKKRYAAVPETFWPVFLQMSEHGQRAGLLYAILKTYKLVFDFHFSVTLKHWNSIDHTLTKSDIMMEFDELSSRDEFVASWSDNTKGKCASQYLTMLRGANLLDENTGQLQALHLEPSDFEYYIRNGEEWFLDACLLYPYEINEIKSRL